ncbi:MAG: ABC transporter permease subunit [Candidatus Aminicenantes bacterium]|nr:ABC transporter permease subunit [Candidatus Aminicenantes bacterium]
MPIKEKGYAHWDGEFQEKKFPWWPITRYGIKLTFRRKFFKLLFTLALAPALVFLAGIYISERLEEFQFMIQGDTQFLNINPVYFKAFFTNEFMLFMIVMVLVFCGAGLISDDLKYNSLQLYFARPVTKKDYFLGKATVIVFFIFILTLIPGLVFIIMKLIFAGNFEFIAKYPWLPLSVIGYSLLLTVFFSFYGLFLSSVNKNRRYVAILIFGLYFFTEILFGIFQDIFRIDYFALLSIRANIQQVGAVLFGQKTPHDIPWVFSLLVITGFCVLSGFVLKGKIKGVDIVK